MLSDQSSMSMPTSIWRRILTTDDGDILLNWSSSNTFQTSSWPRITYFCHLRTIACSWKGLYTMDVWDSMYVALHLSVTCAPPHFVKQCFSFLILPCWTCVTSKWEKKKHFYDVILTSGASLTGWNNLFATVICTLSF